MEANAPVRPVGRPPVAPDDKRVKQQVFSRNEWAEVQRRAAAKGMSAAAYVRGKMLKGWCNTC